MKKLFVLAFFALLSFNLSAQNFGVKVGYNMSTYTLNFDVPDESKPGMGYNLGLFGEIPINDMIGLRADAAINQLGSDAVYEGTDWKNKFKTNVNYLNFSLISKFNYDIFYGYAGPYVGYAISKKTKTVIVLSDEPNYRETYDDYEYDEIAGTADLNNRTDIGFNIGVGANLYSAFFADINFGIGIASIYDKNSDTYTAITEQANIINDSGTDATTVFFEFVDGTEAVAEPVQRNFYIGLTIGYVIGGQ